MQPYLLDHSVLEVFLSHLAWRRLRRKDQRNLKPQRLISANNRVGSLWDWTFWNKTKGPAVIADLLRSVVLDSSILDYKNALESNNK